MKKLIVILGCAAALLSACSKDDGTEKQNSAVKAEVQNVNNASDGNVNELATDDDDDADTFFVKFNEFNPAQKYYFCAAFAMGAMSVAKPVTASAMINYFMGLGVAKYNVGIDEETYKAFNAGKNSFRNENFVNAILKRKVCEEIMNDAADFARDRNYNVADLDKRGKKEVEKVVQYIKQGGPTQ